MLGRESLDFSFSGIKTAVLYHCRGQDMKGENRVDSMSGREIADIAASFQAAPDRAVSQGDQFLIELLSTLVSFS